MTRTDFAGKPLNPRRRLCRPSRRRRRFLIRFIVILGGFVLATPSAVSQDGEARDLVTPAMTRQAPAAGRRVRQVSPEYEGTEVYHALYLPTDWKPGGRYPVIIEYTGNRFPACGSTGEVKDANLGFGWTGGRRFIWVSLPFIDKGRTQNTVTWWGDRQATIEYCKLNVPRICRQFGGDPENVFLCGFSRGAIAVSYIGLADDEISELWKGFLAHDHFDGQRQWNYPESDREAALQRLSRLRGRPVLVSGTDHEFLREHRELADFTFIRPPVDQIFDIPEGPVIHPHTDLWMHRSSAYRAQAREWLSARLAETEQPGTDEKIDCGRDPGRGTPSAQNRSP